MQNTFEYVDETVLNIRKIMRAFIGLLFEKGMTDENALMAFIDRETGKTIVSGEGKSEVITMVCKNCERVVSLRLGKLNRCIYCGTEFEKEDAVQLADLGPIINPETLFTCKVEIEDIDEKMLDARSIEFLNRGAWNDKEVNSQSIVAARGMRRSPRQVINDIDRSIGDSHLLVHTLAGKYDRIISQLCVVLKATYLAMISQNAAIHYEFLEELNRISLEKLENESPETRSRVTCPHCNTDQRRSAFFEMTCEKCETSFDLDLTEGYWLMVDFFGRKILRVRKVEYVYSLFEALYCIAMRHYKLSVQDLSDAVRQQKIDERPTEVCDQCGRKMTDYASVGQKCAYCGHRRGISLAERYL